MQRWVVLGIVGLLVFGNLIFAGGWEESDLQVSTTSKTCNTCSSCQDFDVDRALSEVNAKIENLTKVINQKETELQRLYAELNRTKSVETLEKIVKLEDEAQLLKSEREFYKRQKLSLELIEKYTRRTPYGLQVLYYRLPREDELVREYVEKVHPVRKDVDLDWFIAYYRQAGELTFDKYFEADIELKLKLKSGNITVKQALQLLDKRKKLSKEIFGYLEERDKLQTIKNLRELGRKQTIMETIGIQPLAYNFGGINEGSSCLSWSCPPTMPYPPLPEYTPVYYSYASPTAVWVGMYESNTPDPSKFWGQYCTYEFPSTSTDVKKYWDWAVEKANSKGFYSFKDVGSIQVKLFYSGSAYNPNNGKYQESNLIWQFECHKNFNDGKNECWVVRYKPKLPTYPNRVMFDQYFELYVEEYWLSCCKGGDVGSSCNWANTHCGGCFAPDASSSQNFAWINRPYQEIIIRWEDS